jgi:hypothetical protein
MKVYDDQNELKAAYEANDNFIVTYRTIYEIKFSHGVSEYIKTKIYNHYGKLPLIGKGRFIFTNQKHAHQLMSIDYAA